MKEALEEHFAEHDTLSFRKMTAGQTRRAAAASLFELLVLKTKGLIDVAQPAPLGDITVSPTSALAV